MRVVLVSGDFPDEREQVTGFQMTGEVLGLDGIEKEICQSNAVALEDSEVWEVPFHRLEALCRQDCAMQRMFHRLMSREIQRDYLRMLLLGSMSAEERLAAFLVNLSQRLTARGYSATRFILRMSRREIGSFLRLTLETLSRVVSRFQREGLIRAELKAVELTDTERLRAMVDVCLGAAGGLSAVARPGWLAWPAATVDRAVPRSHARSSRSPPSGHRRASSASDSRCISRSAPAPRSSGRWPCCASRCGATGARMPRCAAP